MLNVYLIQEDGNTAFCIRAKSIGEACSTLEQAYLEEMRDYNEKQMVKHIEADEIEHYRNEILQSVSLVGELRN